MERDLVAGTGPRLYFLKPQDISKTEVGRKISDKTEVFANSICTTILVTLHGKQPRKMKSLEHTEKIQASAGGADHCHSFTKQLKLSLKNQQFPTEEAALPIQEMESPLHAFESSLRQVPAVQPLKSH